MLNWVLIGLAVILLHAIAVGTYLTIYKFKAKKPATAAMGTLAFIGVYSVLLTVVVITVLFVHP